MLSWSNTSFGGKGSHAMLVSSVNSSTGIVYVYEQTEEVDGGTYVAGSGTKVSKFTFSQLATCGYMPFYKE